MDLEKEKKMFFRKMMIIGFPIVIQNLICLGLNLLDTLMIGMLGEEELAAVGAANQVFFILNIAQLGLYSGAAVYTAQYFGAGDFKGVRRMLGIDYLTGALLSVVFTMAGLFIAPNIIAIFSKDPVVIQLGAEYLKIVCLSYIFAGLSMAITYNSRAIQSLKVPTIVNALALCTNGLLNYLLIFGIGFFPRLGVKGAAIATLIARILEFVMLIFYVYGQKNHPFKAGFSELFGFTGAQFKDAMRMAIPVVFTETSWAVSVALIFSAYGRLGTSALAVVQVSNVITDLSQSVFYGVCNATAMIIGETLGQGNQDGAYKKAGMALKIVAYLNIIVTIAMILISKPVTFIYNFNPETNILLMKTVIALALCVTPRMYAYIFIVGIFRAGGDTVFSMILEVLANMLIHVPIAFIAVMFLKTSLPVAIIMGEIGNLIRIVICYPRYKSRKWINIVVN